MLGGLLTPDLKLITQVVLEDAGAEQILKVGTNVVITREAVQHHIAL